MSTSVRSGMAALRQLGFFCGLPRSGSLARRGRELSCAKGFGSELRALKMRLEGSWLLSDLYFCSSGCPDSGPAGGA